MVVVLSVTSLFLAAMVFYLLSQLCRYRPDSWLATDNMVLCAGAPAVLLLVSFGFGSWPWIVINGGLQDFGIDRMIEVALIVAALSLIWRLLLVKIRGGRTEPVAGTSPLDPAKTES